MRTTKYEIRLTPYPRKVTMTITESFQDGVKALRLSGKFDFRSRHVFQTAIGKAGQGGARNIILNLQRVSFVDSAALGLLANMHREFTAQCIHVTLANPQDYVKQVMELVKMDRLFSIHATEEQARSSMAKA